MKTAGRVMAGMVAGTAALCVWAGAARATTTRRLAGGRRRPAAPRVARLP